MSAYQKATNNFLNGLSDGYWNNNGLLGDTSNLFEVAPFTAMQIAANNAVPNAISDVVVTTPETGARGNDYAQGVRDAIGTPETNAKGDDYAENQRWAKSAAAAPLSRYDQLLKMYGITPTSDPNQTGIQDVDAAKQYYQTYGAGGVKDTANNTGVFDALNSVLNWGK